MGAPVQQRRFQQAILTSHSLNPSTSAWLSTPPLSSEPVLRDEHYRQAIPPHAFSHEQDISFENGSPEDGYVTDS